MAALHTGYTPAAVANSSDHTVHVPAVVVHHMDSDSTVAAAGGSNSGPVQKVGHIHSPAAAESHSHFDCIVAWDSGRSRSVAGIGCCIAGFDSAYCRCGAAFLLAIPCRSVMP